MQDINLLQNKLKDRSESNNRRSALIITGVAFFAILVAVGGGLLYVLTKSTQDKADTVATENATIQTALDKGEGEVADAKAYQAQLQNIDRLAKAHLYWSSAFDLVQKSILQRAQYNVLTLSPEGKMHVEGITDSYTGVGKVLLSLSTEPNIKDVKLASTARSGGAKAGYNFSIDFAVNMATVIKK